MLRRMAWTLKVFIAPAPKAKAKAAPKKKAAKKASQPE